MSGSKYEVVSVTPAGSTDCHLEYPCWCGATLEIVAPNRAVITHYQNPLVEPRGAWVNVHDRRDLAITEH